VSDEDVTTLSWWEMGEATVRRYGSQGWREERDLWVLSFQDG